MARERKKKRTQGIGRTKNARAEGVAKSKSGDRVPKSMVIRMGASEVGPKVSQLVRDVRAVMEPHTASRLKERRSNKLRDFTTMAGPLGVSHLLLFSKSEAGNTSFRIAVNPRGPTFNFRVDKYSLSKDIANSQKRHKTSSGGVEHLTPPLLVMNNFKPSTPKPATNGTTSTTSPIPPHLENLSISIFQSLFPPITPQQTPLSSIRRVLLLERVVPSSTSHEDSSYILKFRHYAITSRPIVPLSRGLKRLRAAEKFASKAQFRSQPSRPTENGAEAKRKRGGGSLPNMGRLDDVADFLLDPTSGGGFTSASETEVDTDAEVEVVEQEARKVLNKAQRQRQEQQRRHVPEESGAASMEAEVAAPDKPTRRQRTQKRAIKLTELGPRMTLRLVKVEEGLCGGKVLWHQFVTKTEEEARKQDENWEKFNAEKEEKRRIQRERVAAKLAARRKSGADDEEKQEEEDEEEEGEEGEDEEEEFGDEEMDYMDDEYDDVVGDDGGEDVEEEDVE